MRELVAQPTESQAAMVAEVARLVRKLKNNALMWICMAVAVVLGITMQMLRPLPGDSPHLNIIALLFDAATGAAIGVILSWVVALIRPKQR